MPTTYSDFMVSDLTDLSRLNPNWAEVAQTLPGSDLSSALYGGFLFPDWQQTTSGESDSYKWGGWNTTGLNPATKFMASVANNNAATAQQILRQLYPNATQEQLDAAALSAFSGTGAQNGTGLYDAWNNPIDTVRNIAKGLGGLSEEQSNYLNGLYDPYAKQLTEAHKQYDSIQKSRDSAFYGDMVKSAGYLAALVGGLNFIQNPGLLGAEGASASTAGAGELGADQFIGLGGSSGSSLGATLGTEASLGTGTSLGTSGGFGSNLTASGNLGSWATGGEVGMHTIADPILGNVAPASLSSMGGASGVTGTVNGIGTLTAGGVLVPAAGGAVSLLPGAAVGGIPTSLKFDPVNLAENGALNVDGTVDPSKVNPRTFGDNLRDVSKIANSAMKVASLLGGEEGQGGGGLLGMGGGATSTPINLPYFLNPKMYGLLNATS